ncbi:MAG TPA: hypothetical protein PK593_03480 [Thermomicrobiales bacterium]|nr:hypothetical protein [Thermomicrobiales bacterium]
MRRLARLITVITVLAPTILTTWASPTLAAPPANDAFQSTWARTDQPVVVGNATRTWMWGPEANSHAGIEPYKEAPRGWRTVQYFDKSRMEITHPDASDDGVWYVTNGLLATEMISGSQQIGDDQLAFGSPAEINVAGDPDDPTGPTYATFTALSFPGYTVDPAIDAAVASRIDRDGAVHDDPTLTARGVTITFYDSVTQHNIAGPFWSFMNSSGVIFDGSGYVNGSLFPDPFYATGRPITEPYWANVKVAGTYKDVLMQCFERRCLTYTPDNPEGWQVEAGNVGLHYYAWRYQLFPGTGPRAGMPNYWSNLAGWTQWPAGNFAAGDSRWLGGPAGTAAISNEEYQLAISGEVGAWVGVTAPAGAFDDIVAHVGVRSLLGTAHDGDRSCLLSRVQQDGPDLRFYALCIRWSEDFVAFYYQRVGGVESVDWFVPPGVASAPFGLNYDLTIVAVGADLWFVANGQMLAHVTHSGPLVGNVALAVQRGAPGYTDTESLFHDFSIAAAHLP